MQETPTKDHEHSNKTLGSPPIKLKIYLGSKKTSNSAETFKSTKSNSSHSGSISRDFLDRKKGKRVSESLHEKRTAYSDRKRRSKHKPGSNLSHHESIHHEISKSKVVSKDNSSNDEGKESDQEYTEEEKWLNAVESGNYSSLDKIDSELKNIKDPKLMTARQRAMISGIGGR